MADNLIKVAEIVVKKLQSTGAPLASPTADDVILINYGQDISLEDVITDGERIEQLGPEGVVCALQADDEFTGATVTGNLAKYPKKLKYLLMGGTYVAATDTWTPPMAGTINVAPVEVKFYCEKYNDGENTETDLVGYEVLVLPKAKGRLGALSVSNTAFTSGPFTFNAKDYVAVDPAESKPCYYFDAEAAALPSAGSYAQPFHIVESVGETDLAGVLISVTVNGAPVTGTTDADGEASLTLPYGVHTYTATKDTYTALTGSITVGLVNDTKELEMALA